MIIGKRLPCRIRTKYVRVCGTCEESKQNEADELKTTTVFKQTISYITQQYNTHIAGRKSEFSWDHTQA